VDLKNESLIIEGVVVGVVRRGDGSGRLAGRPERRTS
jgi:hypothetical protein